MNQHPYSSKSTVNPSLTYSGAILERNGKTELRGGTLLLQMKFKTLWINMISFSLSEFEDLMRKIRTYYKIEKLLISHPCYSIIKFASTTKTRCILSIYFSMPSSLFDCERATDRACAQHLNEMLTS